MVEKLTVKELEKQVEYYRTVIEPKNYIEGHPTYKLDEHPDGYEQMCYCRECGSRR